MRIDLEAFQADLEEEREAWKNERGIRRIRRAEDTQLRRLDDVLVKKLPERPPRPCLGDKCSAPVFLAGYCDKHLARVRAGLDVDDDFPISPNRMLKGFGRK